MKQKNNVSGLKLWKFSLVALAFVLAGFVPFYLSGRSSAQSAVGTQLFAPLTGPAIGGVTPTGTAYYAADPAGNKVLETQVGSVNLPAATSLTVLVNGASVGTIRLSTARGGILRLSSLGGQTVPTVADGAPVVVKNGDATVLSGTFTAPPTPSPTPTRSPSPSPSGSPTGSPSPSPSVTPWPSPTPFPTPSLALFAQLTGSTIDGAAPRGFGQYAEFGSTSKRLGFFADHVNLPAGTHLTVFVGTTSVGEIVLDDDGDGSLRLDTTAGATVPTITADTAASIKNGSTTILSGTFRPPTTFPSPSPTPTGSPSPSPTVSPSPSGSPTPTPTPRPNRFFGGHLNGAQVVPAVTTTARGVVFVALNDTETEARVYLGFIGLSSAQTTATINAPALAGETAAAIYTFTAIGGTAGQFPVATIPVTSEQVAQLRTGLWYVQIGSTNNAAGEIRGQIRSRTRHGAFTGAAADDIAVFRPSSGTWYVKNGAGYSTELLGQNGDEPVSADYDGDGKTDAAVFRNGTWLIDRSSDGGVTTKQFGLAGDIPVRGDYDGDGRVDLAVFRPSTGVWYVQKSNGSGYIITQFGLNGDRPVASDLDGDGKTDIALFRPSTGVWYWVRSSNGSVGATQFGMNGDTPVAGDFDGDGADDISVYRPSTGVWYTWRSSDSQFDIRQFGMSGDVPVAGNYDGDGRTDVAVFRPSTGVWYIWRSSDNAYDINYFGLGSDVPATKN